MAAALTAAQGAPLPTPAPFLSAPSAASAAPAPRPGMEPHAGATAELLFGQSAYAVPGDSLLRSANPETLLAAALVGGSRALLNVSYSDAGVRRLAIQGVATRVLGVLRALGVAAGPDAVRCVDARRMASQGCGALGPGASRLPAGPGPAGGRGGEARPLPVWLVWGLEDVEFTELSAYAFADALRAAPGAVLALCASEEVSYPVVELFDVAFHCLPDEALLPRPYAGGPAPGRPRLWPGRADPAGVAMHPRLERACAEFLARLAEVHLTVALGGEEVVSEGPRLAAARTARGFAQCLAAVEGRPYCAPRDLALALLCAAPHQLRLAPVVRGAELRAPTRRLVYRKACRALEEMLRAWL